MPVPRHHPNRTTERGQASSEGTSNLPGAEHYVQPILAHRCAPGLTETAAVPARGGAGPPLFRTTDGREVVEASEGSTE